jgi:hypothetical protein
MSDHEYDKRGLTPLQFFLAVMHDKSLPLGVRMDAAIKAMPYTHHPIEPMFVAREPWPGECRVKIIIGGLGPDSVTSISSDACSADMGRPPEKHSHFFRGSSQPTSHDADVPPRLN